jgi:hypothetical protein
MRHSKAKHQFLKSLRFLSRIDETRIKTTTNLRTKIKDLYQLRPSPSNPNLWFLLSIWAIALWFPLDPILKTLLSMELRYGVAEHRGFYAILAVNWAISIASVRIQVYWIGSKLFSRLWYSKLYTDQAYQ